MNPDRVSITERPMVALDRIEPGHCEHAVVRSERSGSTYALAVFTEKSSNLNVLAIEKLTDESGFLRVNYIC